MKLLLVKSQTATYLYLWPFQINGDVFIISRYGLVHIRGNNPPSLAPVTMMVMITLLVATAAVLAGMQ